jgi:hypothetical protein
MYEGPSFNTNTGPQTDAPHFMVPQGDDRKLFAEFYLESVYQEFESKKQGRPVFKDVAFIRIRTPGVNGSTVERPVRTEFDGTAPPDPDRFPRQWKAFENKQEQVQDGTRIEEWPPLRKSQVMELKAQGVHTVEHIAGMTDNNLGVLGLDGRRLRDMAKAYLEKSAEGATVSKLSAENQDLRSEVEALKAQFAELAANQPKRGPGRPKKENEENGD